jgi:hypothetical protein
MLLHETPPSQGCSAARFIATTPASLLTARPPRHWPSGTGFLLLARRIVHMTGRRCKAGPIVKWSDQNVRNVTEGDSYLPVPRTGTGRYVIDVESIVISGIHQKRSSNSPRLIPLANSSTSALVYESLGPSGWVVFPKRINSPSRATITHAPPSQVLETRHLRPSEAVDSFILYLLPTRNTYASRVPPRLVDFFDFDKAPHGITRTQCGIA